MSNIIVIKKIDILVKCVVGLDWFVKWSLWGEQPLLRTTIQSKVITWKDQCVKNVIRVEEVWDIRSYGLVNILLIKTQDVVAIKESK